MPLQEVAVLGDQPLTKKVVEAAEKAFPAFADQFRKCSQSIHLPDNCSQIQLCYLSLVQDGNRKPFTQAQEAVFKSYFTTSQWTASCLHWMVAVPAFFTPALFPFASYITLSSIDPLYQTTVTTLTSAVSIAIASYAGWKITGTYPDASSTASNLAQNALTKLDKTYRSLAEFLLDLALSGDKNGKAFAQEIAATLDTAKLLKSAIDFIRRFQETGNDPILSTDLLKEIFTPLEESITYITSNEITIPNDPGLRVRIELHQQTENSTKLQKHLFELTGELHRLREALAESQKSRDQLQR